MFVFFVSKIIFLLFFSQTCYTLCFSPSVFDFIILFIEKVEAISMNSFIFPPSKLTHFHYLSVLCLLSTSLTERPALTSGLKILPLSFLIFPSLFFLMSSPLSAQQCHHPHGLLTPCFKKTFLNPTYTFSYCFLFSPVSGKCHIFQKGESSQWYWMLLRGQGSTELDPWKSTCNSLCPFPHLSSLAPSVTLLPHHPSKAALIRVPRSSS